MLSGTNAPMDVSELRKRILRALDDARKEASERRRLVDEAAKDYEAFLSKIAIPVLRQATQVLNATGESFSIHTPAGSARLVSGKSAETFLELCLDSTRNPGEVLGRVSVARGRQGLVVEERPVVPGKSIAALTEEDVSAFLVSEIPKLLVR
jgi:hypothetical protein